MPWAILLVVVGFILARGVLNTSPKAIPASAIIAADILKRFKEKLIGVLKRAGGGTGENATLLVEEKPSTGESGTIDSFDNFIRPDQLGLINRSLILGGVEPIHPSATSTTESFAKMLSKIETAIGGLHGIDA